MKLSALNMNSDTNELPNTSGRERRSLLVYEDSSSDSSDEDIAKTKPKLYIEETDSDLDSFDSFDLPKRKRVTQIESDSSDSSDNSEIVRRVKKSAKIEYDDEDSGEWDTEKPSSSKQVLNDNEFSSDSSDVEAEKCPICLLSFKQQEVGSPEACDHSFCADCIQEWSKNVNTCPVDRRKFNLILVRSHYKGKYVRSIDVQDSIANSFDDIINETIDFTPCEVCGSSRDEDRLLLCDRCDLAYHLECLRPPLDLIPEGEWFCSSCQNTTVGIEILNLNFFLGDSDSETTVNSTFRRYSAPRLVPRTRQTERIRTRIANQREQTEHNEVEDAPVQPGPSTSNTTRRTKKKYKRKKPCKKSKRRPRYKIVYDLDETTGEKIAIKKGIRKYRKRKCRRKKRKLKVQRVIVPKSVKNRLAQQLGIRPPQTAGQSCPEMKVQINSGDIGQRRIQAGIPALHLFGQRDEIDYFSESDTEIGTSGINIIVGRRPNRSDASVLRRATRNKAAILSQPNPTTSVDLLGSILDNQTKLHSRNSIISIRSDGTLKIDVDKKAPTNVKPLDIKNQKVMMKQTPMEPHTSNSGGTTSPSNSNQYRSDRNYESSLPTSTVESSDPRDNASFSGNSENENPQDYIVNQMYTFNLKEKNKDEENPNEEENVAGTSDSELDIYSDIETVSTSKMEDINVKYPSPAPPPMISINTPDDDSESNSDLVIDTEKIDIDKYDPEQAFDSDENAKEEAVTSTSESVSTTTKHNDFAPKAWNSEIQSETVQSSNQIECNSVSTNVEDKKIKPTKQQEELDEVDEEVDDCPNCNIYSSESINLAQNGDVNILMGNIQENVPITSNNTEPAVVSAPNKDRIPKKSKNLGLYSDSEDEAVVKFTPQQPFGIGDISNMTEDISEEERSFTPCLDEKEPIREGLEGLDTEMISDDDKNDFEESQEQELKTVSDGDALEINAKESELDFTRPEECEEGEIIDKTKSKPDEVETITVEVSSPLNISEKEKNKENEDSNKEPIFKKLSKSNKVRNYRDKDNKERSKSREKRRKNTKDTKKDRRKEKRREIERYDVRSIVESKPKRDKFGRDPTRRRSYSSSRSNSPPRRFGREEGLRRSMSISSPSISPRRMNRNEFFRRSISYSSRLEV
ncbi:hypothetical protein FQA39_LY14637 [Lamprigera yunnana]|nr:hypothetical protein FQA39_LY14637 [Lamprigera yunnana]